MGKDVNNAKNETVFKFSIIVILIKNDLYLNRASCWGKLGLPYVRKSFVRYENFQIYFDFSEKRIFGHFRNLLALFSHFYPKSDLKVTEMLANVNFYLFRPQTLGKNSKIFEKITSRNPAYVWIFRALEFFKTFEFLIRYVRG